MVATAITSPSRRPEGGGGACRPVISGDSISFGPVVWRTTRQPQRATRRPETGPNRTFQESIGDRLEVLATASVRKNSEANRILGGNPVWSGFRRLPLASEAEERIVVVSGAACRLDMVSPAGPHLSVTGQSKGWPVSFPRPPELPSAGSPVGKPEARL